jgi:hypothetical protein
MKMVLSLFGIALAGVCLADYDQASREGARQLQRGNYAAAVPQLETAVQAAQSFGESDARFAAAMANLARGYFLQGRYRGPKSSSAEFWRRPRSGCPRNIPKSPRR